MSRAWNDDANALIWKAIHIQDNLVALFGLCLHRGTAKQNYRLVIKLLPNIRYNLETLENKARELIDLKPTRKRGGRPPKWFELAEDILYFSIQAQKSIDQIEEEITGNYWKIIQTRLTVCLRDCRKLQYKITSAIPKDRHITDTYLIQAIADVMDTIEMGRTGEGKNGRRWKRNG
jgi:hypothetical protein